MSENLNHWSLDALDRSGSSARGITGPSVGMFLFVLPKNCTPTLLEKPTSELLATADAHHQNIGLSGE